MLSTENVKELKNALNEKLSIKKINKTRNIVFLEMALIFAVTYILPQRISQMVLVGDFISYFAVFISFALVVSAVSIVWVRFAILKDVVKNFVIETQDTNADS